MHARQLFCSIAILGTVILISGSSAIAGGKKASGTLKAKVECGALAGRAIPSSKIGLPTGGATITSATLDPGSGDKVNPIDFVPAFCKIDGAIAPVDPAAPPIHFRVDIPVNWNQKAIQIAGVGSDGFIPNLSILARGKPGSPLGPAFPPDVAFPIAQGYATYGGDAGHSGGAAQDPTTPPKPGCCALGYMYSKPGTGAGGTATGRGGDAEDPAWWGNEEALANYSHVAIKKTHDVAVAVMNEMYGVRPRFTYFMGESQGGRAAMSAVAYYPEDYDGVLASVPIVYYTGLHTSRYYRIKLQTAPGAWVPPTKAAAIGNEVLRQCDSLDGIADGVISNYYACNRLFNPMITPNPLAKIRCPGGADTGNDCLSDTQIATIDAFHSPMKWGFPMSSGETEYPGIPAGSENAPGWVLLSVQPDPAKPGLYEGIGNPLFREKYSDPKKYSILTHSFSDLQEPFQDISKVMDVSADWSKFFAHGGKLILHTAANDDQGNSPASMFLYEQEVKRVGQAKVDKQVRFYVTPMANHGSVSFSATTHAPQARYMDLVSALEDWVEKGTAPDTLAQTLKETTPPYNVIRSRPLCRYPKYPRYKGTGDPDKMESYTCAAP